MPPHLKYRALTSIIPTILADNVNEATDEWRRRLWACVRGMGRHFEFVAIMVAAYVLW